MIRAISKNKADKKRWGGMLPTFIREGLFEDVGLSRGQNNMERSSMWVSGEEGTANAKVRRNSKKVGRNASSDRSDIKG